MTLHTAVMIEQPRAMAPTQYPILLLLLEFPLSCLQRGQMQECRLPVQRLVIPAGVDSSSSRSRLCSDLPAETATYDCFSSSYLSISGIRGCDAAGGGGRGLLEVLSFAGSIFLSLPH